LWSPCTSLQTRRSKEKREACSLVYGILALVIVQGHLAGSRPTVLVPALCFSPIRRGDSLDSTYHPATRIRSPTPLEQPIDWEPVHQHGATTDTTLVPSSASSRTYINPIGHVLRRVFVPSEVSDIIREGLQLGAQQRAEEEQLAELWQRVHEARTRVEERLNREERIPPRHPPFPNLVPRRWFRGAPPRPFLHNRIAPLRPRELLRLPTRFRQDYTRH
jgi:hypothetical protein